MNSLTCFAILPNSTRVRDAAAFANKHGLNLFIDPAGRVICAPGAHPGWQRVGVRLAQNGTAQRSTTA